MSLQDILELAGLLVAMVATVALAFAALWPLISLSYPQDAHKHPVRARARQWLRHHRRPIHACLLACILATLILDRGAIKSTDIAFALLAVSIEVA